MQVFTLYVGSKQARARGEIVRIVAEEFSSFTIIEGEGFFRGTPEPSWLVKIAADDGLKVIRTAERIRAALDQDGVGIEMDGQYHRCTSEQCAVELAASIAQKSERGLNS